MRVARWIVALVLPFAVASALASCEDPPKRDSTGFSPRRAPPAPPPGSC